MDIKTIILRATEMSHLLLALAVKEGDTVVDATAGKGRDTCFLAALVRQSGHVWAFDVQKMACLATQSALIAQGLEEQASVICDDHANLANYDTGELAAAIFNLGWLPDGDHNIVSCAGSTVKALEAILSRLRVGGVIIVVAYNGHEAGAEELAVLREWYTALSCNDTEVMEVSYPAKDHAPCIIVIEKRDKGV